MKGFGKKSVGLILLAVVMMLVAACGESGGGKAGEAEGNAKTPIENRASNDVGKPAVEGDKQAPEGKYSPPVTVTTVRVTNESAYKFAEGESIDNNVWTRGYEEELGIKVVNEWVVDQSQATQKMNVTIASGELPDVMAVNATQLKQLLDADLIEDMTEAFEKYASPFTKEIMSQDGGMQLASATFDGKLKAIVFTGSALDGAPLVWLRQDWLDKLKLPAPKTMDDLIRIADAFVNEDPDGNHKKDTEGFTFTKTLYGGNAGLIGFFNGYHAYPNGTWVKDSTGNLVYGGIQPEMKSALAKLQELYKNGLIDKEFGVADDVKVAEKATSGKVGILFAGMSAPIGFLQKGIDLNPDAQWQAYPIVSADDKPALGQLGLGAGEYYVVRKGFEHPEAIVKLLNFWMEKKYGTIGYPNPYIYDAEDRNTTNYATIKAYPWTKNLDAHLRVTEAIKSKDTSKLNAEEMSYHNNIVKYLEGDNKFWQWDRVFGEFGSWAVINEYNKDNAFVRNEFYASPTSTMVSKGSILNKKELEAFTDIIKGAPIDSYDKFVAEWKKLGGDQMTQEVNEWYKSK